MIHHSRSCLEKPETEIAVYDHKVDKKVVSEIIIYHDLPLCYVEYEKVRREISILIHNVSLYVDKPQVGRCIKDIK